MGALVMTHSDDAGLVLPPKLAPIEVVLVPIYKGEEQMAEIVAALQGVADELEGSGHSSEARRRRFEAFGVEVCGIRIEGCAGSVGHGASRSRRRNDRSGSARYTEPKRSFRWKASQVHVKGLLEEIQNVVV